MGADASGQNAAEHHHLTAETGVRALLIGSGVLPQFWPYAFQHYIRLKNARMPGQHQNTSPIEEATGQQDDFSQFHTFGCRVCLPYDGPLPQRTFRGPYFAYLTDSQKIFSQSIPVPVCSPVFSREGVDQPVHRCLDTLHRHFTRYWDRPYGGMLPNNIDRMSSLFY